VTTPSPRVTSLAPYPLSCSARRALSSRTHIKRYHVSTHAVASGSMGKAAVPSSNGEGQSSQARMEALVGFLREELPRLFQTGVSLSYSSCLC
jgi:hypothetical protein